MDTRKRYQLTNVVLFGVALSHGVLTWSIRSTLTLFVCGVAVAFVAEALAVRAGLLEHELGLRLAGVPLTILLAWPALIYVFCRGTLLVVPAGVGAAAVTAILATGLDVLTDQNGVQDGVWRYPGHPLSEPRFRGVPWWNFAGWLVIVFVTSLIPLTVGG